MYITIAPGIDVYFFESLSSTQEQARFMAEEGYPDGTIILTKEQIMGKGRMGRRWVSEPGNLYMTYISRPDCSASKAAEMSFVSCIAAGDGMRRFLARSSQELNYKWPNDLMLNKQKVGGVLLETVGKDPEKLDAVLIGVGINLQNTPESANYPVTSFLQEGMDVSIDQALQVVAENLQAAIEMWRLQGFSPIRNRWLEHVYGMGEVITVKQGNKTFQGRMQGIDDSGALIISSKIGATDYITAGDVLLGGATTVKD